MNHLARCSIQLAGVAPRLRRFPEAMKYLPHDDYPCPTRLGKGHFEMSPMLTDSSERSLLYLEAFRN